MAALDWIFVALLLASMLMGAWRGLVYEFLSLAGWVVAFVVAQWFAQDAAAHGHGRVGAKDHVLGPGGNGQRLFPRQPHGIGAGKLSLAGVLVDVGGQDQVGHDPQLRQQFLAARAARSQDEPQLT